MQNTQIHLVSRPGPDGPGLENFDLVQVPLRALTEGDVLLKTEYLSLDPYMRARMYEGVNYAQSAQLGEPMTGSTVAVVLASKNPGFVEGEFVESWHGWQSHHISNGEGLQKIDAALAPVSTAVGVLGMPGHTGYGGMLRHGKPQAGETVLVSAASGTVGSVAAQVARIKGARVVGIAGGAQKCTFLTDTLRLDAAVDHRAPDFAKRLALACPDGIDVYFDNVGGEVFAAALPLMNAGGRIAVCGTIAVNRDGTPPIGEDRMNWVLSRVLVRQLVISGFIYPQFLDMTEAFRADVSGWIADGKLAYREDIVDGLENAPQAFLGLFEGRNFGKLLVRP